jgi:hypothetical protein
MASVQGPARKGSVEKKVLIEKMDKIFRTSPYKAKARDGSGEMITLEHRIGADGGHETTESLMKRLGLQEEYASYVIEMGKRIRNDEAQLKEVLDEKYRLFRSKVTHTVSGYRKRLELFYAKYPRPLLPMFAFVPVGDKDNGLYFQGLLDAGTYKLVIGEPEDDCLWCETVFEKTKTFADLNKRAELTAKALTTFPGLNKDLKYRVARISQGELPEKRIEFKG